MSSLSPPGERPAVSDHDHYKIMLIKTGLLGVNLKFSVPLSCKGLKPREEMSSTLRLICLLVSLTEAQGEQTSWVQPSNSQEGLPAASPTAAVQLHRNLTSSFKTGNRKRPHMKFWTPECELIHQAAVLNVTMNRCSSKCTK